MSIPGYAELEFNLPEALLHSLVATFAQIDMSPLTTANTSKIPNEQGVYQLHLKCSEDDSTALVYIGKTDSDAGLRSRLGRHAKRLRGRVNLQPEDVFFKAIRLYVFTAMDLETELIRHYGGVREIPWNHSGFGANDPGKARDTTTYKSDHFDTQFPIDLDSALVPIAPGTYLVSEIMRCLKDKLPYLLRYQRPAQSRNSFHPDFESSRVTLVAGMSTRQVIEYCVRVLPAGWHATALPSHVIAYKDDTRRFPSGTLIAES